MAKKKTGISPDLMIPPGETVADILEERAITRGDLAAKMGVSLSSVDNLILGKEDISEPLASGLEQALNIPRSFWLNLQANYKKELSGLAMEKEGLSMPNPKVG